MGETITRNGLDLIKNGNSFEIMVEGRKLLSHSPDTPFIFLGNGQDKMDMYRGNFDIQDYVEERIGLRHATINQTDEGYVIRMRRSAEEKQHLVLTVHYQESMLKINFSLKDMDCNRFWIRVSADSSEKVYGCGEQLSHLNLRGKNFPLWTSEPGVGRNKSTYTTWQADVKDKAGGDYYTTNYPQPTFISTEKYYCHVDTTAYADFDFRNDHFHELHTWEVPESIQFRTGDSYKDIVSSLTEQFGRQSELPEWVYDGIWLGIQGGTEKVQQKIDLALKKGIKIGAIWCQDWQGKRVTSFGRRLMWNWKWDPNEYPGLDKKIREWKEKGIRFLGYINPYVAVEGDLYKSAHEKGYLAVKQDGSEYLVDFGEFYCGVVDFTNEAACQWYKQVIKENMIDFGLDGWMADFGEYLPIDVKLYNNESPKVMHNAWPALWAKVNYEALEETGKLNEIVYFMRAGYTGIQKYCPLLWAGDQSVDWSMDDGLASVIPAALSAGLSGHGIHHSDIGGYTSLHGNKRSKELLLRWLEMAAFTPVLRTHEGNRPDDNYQYDDDEDSLDNFSRMVNVYVELAPYMKNLVKENAEQGIPVQRPLFMEYEDDELTYDIQYQYMLGSDVLVAPVFKENQETWEVYLPEDEWVHLWSENTYNGGTVTVSAPLGEPPVFYRKTSEFASLFQKISKNNKLKS